MSNPKNDKTRDAGRVKEKGLRKGKTRMRDTASGIFADKFKRVELKPSQDSRAETNIRTGLDPKLWHTQ